MRVGPLARSFFVGSLIPSTKRYAYQRTAEHDYKKYLIQYRTRSVLLQLRNLWEMRYEEVYGEEEVTKQQKRKEKAAISVRELHNLQEIARPSHAKIFYEDVEKEIEKGTAATVEGFVTIKTRPIHNSIKK